MYTNTGKNIANNNDILTMNTITMAQHKTITASQSPANIAEPVLPKREISAKVTNPSSHELAIPVTACKDINNKVNNSSGYTTMNTKISRTPSNGHEFAETVNETLSNFGISHSHEKKYRIEAPTVEIKQQKPFKSLNISFENICYGTKTGFFRRDYKQIINGISGEFRAGELSAVIGPSGVGKSTLLKIIALYTAYGYSGDIKINGKLRDAKAFKPNVAFITQDTELQQFLTVKEAMHFAANLKIGSEMSKVEKRERALKILEAVDLTESLNTITGDLSGGQKKRLAISLELVNNPPVLILDEPTSGLDSSTTNNLISLLKNLALEGPTIICTIHQPSGITFRKFDHLYAMAEGACIYAGRPDNLVPFLAENDLPCPQSYNPCDFLMEIGTNEYGPNNQRLIEKMRNGGNNEYRLVDRFKSTSSNGIITSKIECNSVNEWSHQLEESVRLSNNIKLNVEEEEQQRPRTDSKCVNLKKPKMAIDKGHLCKRENVYATPFYRQLGILLTRTYLILWRDSSLTTLRFGIHFGAAILIGFLYYGIGNDAANAFNIFRYAFYTIMFISFSAFSSILTRFPLEFPIVSREHFNRWYSLRAYYVALTLADIPIQIICSSLFLFTSYYLTGQPLELMRFVLYFFITVLTALVGQSIGLTVGSALNVQYGAILGPFFICPFLVFSGFFLQRKDSPVYLEWLFDISFLKHALDGSMLALFGYGRDKLECHEMYCHHRHPAFFLKNMDLVNISYKMSAIYLIVLLAILRILAFYIMSFRLRLFR